MLILLGAGVECDMPYSLLSHMTPLKSQTNTRDATNVNFLFYTFDGIVEFRGPVLTSTMSQAGFCSTTLVTNHLTPWSRAHIQPAGLEVSHPFELATGMKYCILNHEDKRRGRGIEYVSVHNTFVILPS